EEASRFASVMAVMHRDLETSLLRMLKDQGAGKQAAQSRVAKVMAKLKPEKMKVPDAIHNSAQVPKVQETS
ncbi:MAG: hypothetical protein Q9M16_08745, partial [Mariprofundus sp.]|nr:hypothetical protein [Mariprofundus sp.]